jgi:hypothetical protein
LPRFGRGITTVSCLWKYPSGVFLGNDLHMVDFRFP